MLAIRGIISFHATNFSPIRSLRQEKIKGEELSTCATVACLCHTIWYRHGYWSLKDDVPNHWSSQNLIWVPFLIENFPNCKKLLFTFMRPAQKWELPSFQKACDSGLAPRYLLRINCYQVPSVVSNLNNHLLNNAMFWISRSWIPSPPWSLG
jgi:hypothetical protein